MSDPGNKAQPTATDRLRTPAQDDPDLHELSVPQALALEAILAGSSNAEAAQLAGVNRVTVWRWQSHVPAFIAALNRARLARARRIVDRADTIAMRALDTVDRLVAAGDSAACFRFLSLYGLGQAIVEHRNSIDVDLTATADVAGRLADEARLDELERRMRQGGLDAVLARVEFNETEFPGVGRGNARPPLR